MRARSPTPDPAPAGFPGCQGCPYRQLTRPGVCLACLRRSVPDDMRARCASCGQAKDADRACTNRWCGRADRAWSVAFSVAGHSGALRRALVAYKYRDQRWWGDVFGRLVAGWLRANPTWVEEFDLLVPVPAYLGPGARRQWDPVGTLAAAAAAALGPRWELAAGAVTKTAETPAMTGRSATQRSSIAEGPLRAALAVPDPAAIRDARVLVLDDVITDGATLREVARVLRAAGAAEVAGLALTRPAWSPSRQRPTVGL